MTIHFSRRGFIRVISYLAAAIVVVGFMLFSYRASINNSRRALSYQYMKSMSDISAHMQNIDSDLTKVLYTKSPELLTALSSKIWREAGFAKELLTSLPVEYLKLQSTNKFLSQVGDYCQSLSKSASRGKAVTAEQQENIKKLHGYSKAMLSETLTLADAIQTGSISLEKAQGNISREFDKQQAPMQVSEGFTDFEEGFTAYPTLIYDGPFSDHIMQKEPLRLKNEQSISRAQAKQRVRTILNVDEASLHESSDEDSKLPSYGFTSDDVDVSMTKKGGLMSYMLRSRAVAESKLTPKEAEKKAFDFLNRIIDTTSKGSKVVFEHTYYEIDNNVITFNLACKQGDVLVYPELIKIGVALDNGEIHSFDARGYIVNHFERDIVPSKLTAEEAQSRVSSLLAVKEAKRCIIPSDGLNEIMCYEFLCDSPDNKQVLVYINADTGAEERILILMIDENGQLTI